MFAGSAKTSGGLHNWYMRFTSRGKGTLDGALLDLLVGLTSWRIWWTLAWNDIRQKYRGSVLGPFWLTISMGAFIAMTGVVYATIFKVDVAVLLPYIAVGMITWTLLTGLITEGCNAFVSSEGYLRQVRLPLSVFVCRVVVRNVIALAHNALIFVAVVLWFGVPVTVSGIVLGLLGLAAIVAIGYFWALLLACLCVRFRDIPQIVATIMTGAFFVTPVLWKPNFLGDGHPALAYNPFYYLVEVVRKPLFEGTVNGHLWVVVLGFLVISAVLGLGMFRIARPRITYWI